MIVLSVASGTSADGLDVGAVDLAIGDDGVIEAAAVLVLPAATATTPTRLRLSPPARP